MDINDLFKIIVRWAHLISAAAWVGGSIFWLLILKPSSKNISDDVELNSSVQKEFRALVNTCIFVMLATGAIMTFDRLSSTTLGSNYVLILGLKIATVALMFYLIRAQRKSYSNKASIKNKTEIKTLPARLLSSYNLIIVLGLLAFLLSDLLYHIYNNTLNS